MNKRLLGESAASLLRSGRARRPRRAAVLSALGRWAFKVGSWMFAVALLAAGAQLHAQTGIYVSSNNNVGIGTTSPTRMLDITSADAASQIKSTGVNNHGLLIIDETGGGVAKSEIRYNDNGSAQFAAGIDPADSDKYKISNYINVGTNDRLVVTTGGNVGIGTTNPTRGILHVAGGRINLEGNSGDAAAVITLGNATYPTAQITAPYAGGTLSLSGASGNGILIGASGNVGIGTSNPSASLHVTANNGVMFGSSPWPNGYAGQSGGRLALTGINGNACLFLQDDSPVAADVGSSGLYFTGRYSNTGPAWTGYALIAGRKTNATDSDKSGYLVFATNSNWSTATEKMRITSAGNVGIGTTNPTRGILHVAGGRINLEGNSGDAAAVMTLGDATYPTAVIVTPYGGGTLSLESSSGKGLLIDTLGQVHASAFVAPSQTYADFVFKPGYKLEPLSDIETAIKKDGHLPGIPSEAEAKAHGIDLASMQVKLLQKIEELTLHQIDQEKRIGQLEKENAELREKVTK